MGKSCLVRDSESGPIWSIPQFPIQQQLRNPGVDLFHARSDSTPLALVNQIGILGTLLFYLTLIAAARRDRRAVPVYVGIFLAGMMINLLELFPVNFLLRLLLCHSLLSSDQKEL
jgi:hypothetical protein